MPPTHYERIYTKYNVHIWDLEMFYPAYLLRDAIEEILAISFDALTDFLPFVSDFLPGCGRPPRWLFTKTSAWLSNVFPKVYRPGP